MNALSKKTLTAAFAFASLFIVSCGEHTFDDISNSFKGDDNDGGESSSSSTVDGSAPSYGTISYEGKTYKTVAIGSQIWMAENLNYAVDGSFCGNVDDIKIQNTAFCDKYGRLYSWSTAMNLHYSCDLKPCAGQIGEKHQGICPSGWHIPNDVDWNILINYADGTGGSEVRDSPKAGNFLKATSGWSNYGPTGIIDNGNGTDDYGFSALPGGSGYGSTYDNDGYYGYWWSATEYEVATRAYIRTMYYTDGYVLWDKALKEGLKSVRCVKDDGSSVGLSSYSVAQSSNSTQSIEYGGETYPTVTIGEQTWFAKNLNIDAERKKCYDALESNCDKYGGLYDWLAITKLPRSQCEYYSCNTDEKHQGICPGGWHIPTDKEWATLINYVDSYFDFCAGYDERCSSATAGKYLKATSGWDTIYERPGNGTDDYNFSVLPSGYGSSGGSFRNAGTEARFWSASRYGFDEAQYWSINQAGAAVWGKSIKGGLYYSVRCVKD